MFTQLLRICMGANAESGSTGFIARLVATQAEKALEGCCFGGQRRCLRPVRKEESEQRRRESERILRRGKGHEEAMPPPEWPVGLTPKYLARSVLCASFVGSEGHALEHRMPKSHGQCRPLSMDRGAANRQTLC